MDRLKEIATNNDSIDELSIYRDEFILPKDKLYFDGNSLGLLSKKIINDIKTANMDVTF